MHRGSILRPLALVALSILLASASCKRDNDGPAGNPSIEFVTDPGFTYLSDTVPQGETLLVGVRIRRGGDRLSTFKVLSTYDAGRELVQDSLRITTDTLAFDKAIQLRAQAGTERWTFWVQEADGDVIRRSLTFTVQ